MRIFGVMNFKGGVGKTFIASHLIGLIARKHRKKVLGLDMDMQGDLMKWVSGYSWNKQDKFLSINGIDLLWGVHPDFENGITLPDKKYDYVVIDGRPDLQVLAEILPMIDFVLIPVKGRLSFESAQDVKETVSELKSSVKCYVIKNEMLIRRAIATKEETEFCLRLGVQILEYGLYRLARVRQAEVEGKMIWEIPFGKVCQVYPMLTALADDVVEGKL